MTHPLRHRRAFTLLELLTVIGIIVILAAMLFVAFKYVRSTSGKQQTKVMFESLNAMTAEAHVMDNPPVAWRWYAGKSGAVVRSPLILDDSFSSNVAGTNYSSDFWRYNVIYYPQQQTASGSPAWDALDAPGNVTEEFGDGTFTPQRHTAAAILNTQIAMQTLCAIPANRTALDQLPASSKFLPTYYSIATSKLRIPDAQGVSSLAGVLKEDFADGTSTLVYPQGIHVTDGKGKFYKATSSSLAASPDPGQANAPWYDETATPQAAPLLLDGWGNPIIFVPATGLHVKLLNGKSSYGANDPTQNYIWISPEGHVTGNGTANPVVDKIGKPFWASAGPDGDFTKGDDNIYSFQN